MTERLQSFLGGAHPVAFSVFAGLAAFITYFAMYAFRKPFTAGVYEGLMVGPFDYKIIAITAQVLGYTISKFAGIKVVSEMSPGKRVAAILLLMGVAWSALLGFAAVPAPYNLFFLIVNGLPLGMIWGIVFSFLEGRKFTEMLGATMASSFIVASGAVKAVGLGLVENQGVSEFWMPFMTGMLFVPALLLGTFMLRAIPAPNAADEVARTKRIPMDGDARKRFFMRFAPGIVLAVLIYIALTIFRDVRDNFAVELWKALGYGGQPEVLALAEIPIAVGVMIIIAFMSYVRSNRSAFYLNFVLIVTGGVLLLLTTTLFTSGSLDPAAWMIINGFGMYLAYIAYHTFLFERWIALFRYPSNIGFLMYVADAFGYLGSVGVLFVKNFSSVDVSWLDFFRELAFITGGAMIVLGLAGMAYFLLRERALVCRPSVTAPTTTTPLPVSNV